MQYLANVLGYSDDSTTPCGVSGNPVGLGTAMDKSEHNSCFVVGVQPPYPHWGGYSSMNWVTTSPIQGNSVSS
jgi:hypothetical protein